MDDSTIEGVDRIQESLIGRGSKIVKGGERKFYRFHIANHFEGIHPTLRIVGFLAESYGRLSTKFRFVGALIGLYLIKGRPN
jgi:hypothetical protein